MDEVGFESTQTMTPAEFAGWVQRRAAWDPSHYELLNGRIVMNPPAGFPHGSVEASVVSLLRNFAHAHALGQVVGSSQGFALPSGDTVEPDASFVSKGRWEAMAPPEHGEFLRVVPDLVVEILSGSTRSRDLGEKKAIYARNGVTEYWLVDPRARDLTMFVLSGDHYDAGRSFAETDHASSRVLAGLQLDVGELFP